MKTREEIIMHNVGNDLRRKKRLKKVQRKAFLSSITTSYFFSIFFFFLFFCLFSSKLQQFINVTKKNQNLNIYEMMGNLEVKKENGKRT